jgi:hypothetical protein
MRCSKCFAELSSPTAFCLYCGNKNAIGCGVFAEDRRIIIFFIGKNAVESLSFRLYDEEESIRNMFEVVAERVHERRIDEIYVSGVNSDLIDKTAEMLKIYSLSPVSVYITDPFPSANDFSKSLIEHLRTMKELKKVDIKPEDKIHGAHSTIIGGRDGLKFIHKVASSEYVKKVVPGVIEAKGSAVGGGVRFKLTRCDDRGNIRGLLIDGATVQEIHIVTTARNREEGELILRILRGTLEESD